MKGRGKNLKFFKLYSGDVETHQHFVPIINRALDAVQNNGGSVINYEKIIDSNYDDDEKIKYYYVDNRNIADSVIRSMGRALTYNMPSISKFKPRPDAKNRLPFNSVLVTMKNHDSSFIVGIIHLKSSLKLDKGTHVLLRLFEDRYKIFDDDAANILIPKRLSILITGHIKNETAMINKVYFRKNEHAFFEWLFGYEDFWQSEANNSRQGYVTNLEIPEPVWQDFTRGRTRARKFTLIMRGGLDITKLAMIEDYKNQVELKSRLKFEIVNNKGDKKINIETVEGVHHFLACYEEKILELPRTHNWFSVSSKKPV